MKMEKMNPSDMTILVFFLLTIFFIPGMLLVFSSPNMNSPAEGEYFVICDQPARMLEKEWLIDSIIHWNKSLFVVSLKNGKEITIEYQELFNLISQQKANDLARDLERKTSLSRQKFFE